MTHSVLQRVDLVSDVVCPWCVIGYRQLAAASAQTAIAIDVHWHPFELNPQMAPEGEDLREHVARKYGASAAQSEASRTRIAELGAEVGFTFDYRRLTRIYNTFRAHQLLYWAGEQGRQQALQMALFDAYFSHGQDVSDPAVLAEVAGHVGLDPQIALAVVREDRYAAEVRADQRRWLQRGVSGVPTFVFDQRLSLSGAQGTATFAHLLQRLIDTAAG